MNDEQLLKSCLAGNVEEYQKIVNKYKAKALAVAMNILGNREDAEDASQDAFIQVYQNLERFDFQKSFAKWFYSILTKRCLDRLRKRKRFLTFFQKAKTEPQEFTGTQPVNPAHVPFLKKKLMVCLSPKERLSLCLWANDGYTSREIASVMNCSASTARVYIFKARKKIKALLEKENGSM